MLKQLFTSPKRHWWVFYLPILPYYLYLSIRSGSFTFPTACNPSMLAGGLVNESKFQHLSDVDQAWKPVTVFLPAAIHILSAIEKIRAASLLFPFIIKPDRGEKGWGVQMIHSEEELQQWLQQNQVDAVVQEFINLPVELGIVYYRFPDGQGYGISSIGIKLLPSVTGNGRSTMEELLRQHAISTDGHRYITNLHVIPAAGQQVNTDFVAHRRRGTKFLDARQLIDPELTTLIHRIVQHVEGFDIGRLDIKTSNIADLRSGKQCRILEINGAGSLPIHVFDPRVSFFAAYRDLYKHWKLIYRISKQNHALGTPYMPFKEFVRQLKKAGSLPHQFNPHKNNTT